MWLDWMLKMLKMTLIKIVVSPNGYHVNERPKNNEKKKILWF